jgi:hypothetical protein
MASSRQWEGLKDNYIAELGDEEHIDVVIGRLRSFVKRKNRQDMTYRMTFLRTHTRDWAYPVSWWTGADGVNEEAVTFWFPEI